MSHVYLKKKKKDSKHTQSQIEGQNYNIMSQFYQNVTKNTHSKQ